MAIRKISIIHHSHADFGYTDHPEVAAELQKEFVRQALRLVCTDKGNGSYRWTCEVQEPVRAFWEEASFLEKKQFSQAIKKGKLEVCVAAFNMTPFLNSKEWELCLNWLPVDLRRIVKSTCLMQTDVNGVPRTAIRRALDAGVKYLWMGANLYRGGWPFPAYHLFYWRQPDGRKILAFQNAAYNNGFYIFNENWRNGPIPAIGDMTYRCPTNRDYFQHDKKHILEAHRHCLEKLAEIEGRTNGNCTQNTGANVMGSHGGYPYSILPVSLAGQWRFDNDPPFAGLDEFVYEWNKLGLEPELELSTPSRVLGELEAIHGAEFPEYRGEWPDWWALGSISMPLALSACRDAERTLEKLERIVHLPVKCQKIAEKCRKELVWYNEHACGYWGAVAYTQSRETIAQSCKKQNYAFEAQALARWQLTEQIRKKMSRGHSGVTIWNASDVPTERYVFLETEALRCEVPAALQDDVTGEQHLVHVLPGTRNFAIPKPEYCSKENTTQHFADIEPGRKLGVHTGVIPPHSIRHFSFARSVSKKMAERKPSEVIGVDGNGWPISISFGNGKRLLCGALGDFFTFTIDAFSPRWQTFSAFQLGTKEHQKKMAQQLRKCVAAYEQTQSWQENNIYVYEQNFSHDYLLSGYRRLEIYPESRQMIVHVHLYRLPQERPQTWYLRFPLNTGKNIPTLCMGGVPFKPGIDQLPGTCQEFFNTDDTVVYKTADSTLVWSMDNSGLVSFGEPCSWCRRKEPMKDPNIVNAVILDDFWDTNFPVAAHGPLDFTFHLAELSRDTTIEDAIHFGHELTHTLEMSLKN